MFETDMGAIYKAYKNIYWNQIFSFKTSWEVKKIAIQSLWIVRGRKYTNKKRETDVQIPLPKVEYDEETQAFLDEYRKTREENKKNISENILIN